MIIPRVPTFDQPIDIQWGKDVVAALRARTPRAGYGLMIHEDTGGFNLSATSRTAVVPEPKRTFDLTITSASLKVVRCWYLRGMVYCRRNEEPTIALPDSGTTATLCAKVNLETGAVGLSFTPNTDGTDDPDNCAHIPIYELARASGGARWHVSVDQRSNLAVMAYL